MASTRVRTQAQKDRAKQIRDYDKDRANAAKRVRKPTLGKKKAIKAEKEHGEAYDQENSDIQLNKLLEARQNLQIAKKRLLKRKVYNDNLPGVIKKRQERRRKHDLKEMKKRAHYADCSCDGYPRLIVGKRRKTENDLWHEDHHKTFKQDPLEDEAYAKAEADAEAACPWWVNKLCLPSSFDVGQF